MAFSLNYKMFFLFVHGYLFVTTHAAAPTLLEKVCKKTVDIDFCLNVFGSDPATRTASLPGLAQIAIDKATDKAMKTRTDTKTRSFFTSDPKLKDVLMQCVHEYDSALAALRIAPVDLRKGHYADLYRHANDAARGAVACERGFIDKSLPSPLTRANLQLGDYCNIIEVIAIY
ncbi:pectinesterase inhibitor-like [Primulina huaijiensis]|uniref:pectinesterase inhibitor-like n=1 Tax=Primulina huaijiensis TaxID=1492673 RepID=UPI003CC785F0